LEHTKLVVSPSNAIIILPLHLNLSFCKERNKQALLFAVDRHVVIHKRCKTFPNKCHEYRKELRATTFVNKNIFLFLDVPARHTCTKDSSRKSYRVKNLKFQNLCSYHQGLWWWVTPTGRFTYVQNIRGPEMSVN